MAGEQKSASKFVTVACKVALPWIDFELCEMQTVSENTQTGPRDIKQFFRTGQKVRIRGTAYPRGEPPEGFPEKPQLVLGYALTPNVPRELWEKIVEQHKKAPYFQSGMIYHFESQEDIKAKAKEHEGQLSGLEPIARAKVDGADAIIDARMPRSMHGAVSNVTPGTRAA